MLDRLSFKGYIIVSCGTLRGELNFLNKNDFLNADKILYTAPGLHESPRELEKQLKEQLTKAKKYSQKIIVVYGDKCYIDIENPSRDINTLIQELDNHITRIKAKNCIDMLTGINEREKIAKSQKIYWLSPGWMEYWKVIFKNWDKGKANETFPQHDKAIVLDALDMFRKYSTNSPEKILEFADWMGLGIEPYIISLDRLRNLLKDQILIKKED